MAKKQVLKKEVKKKRWLNEKLEIMKKYSKKKHVRKIVAVCVTGAGLLVFFRFFAVKGLTLNNEVFIEDITYRGYIGRVHRIKKPKNIKTFKTKEDAINFVRGLKYDVFISEPSEVLDKKMGNCIGKARLLYYIGKEQGFSVKFIKEEENHVKVKVDGKVYDLTK